MGMRVKLLTLAVGLLLVSAPAALAQEYGASTGDLVLPAGNLRPGATVEVGGQGFLPDSEVLLGLMANATGTEYELGSTRADGSGAVSASVAIPGDLEPGAYTLSAVGVTADGATLTLAGAIEVDAPEAAPTTTQAPATTDADVEVPEALPFEGGDDGGSNTGVVIGVSALALLLVGGFAYWRYRTAAR